MSFFTIFREHVAYHFQGAPTLHSENRARCRKLANFSKSNVANEEEVCDSEAPGATTRIAFH